MLHKKPVMLKELEIGLTAASAGIFGWVAVALRRVAQKQMTWRVMASSLMLAAAVGFITGTLLNYAMPTLPTSVVSAICTPIGAACDFWMLRYMGFLAAAADRLETKVLDSIGEPDPHEPENDTDTSNQQPENEQ